MSEQIMVYHPTWGAKQIDSSKLAAYKKNGYTVTPEVEEALESEAQEAVETRIEQGLEVEEAEDKKKVGRGYKISKD